MKNLRPTCFPSTLGILAGLLLILALAGCDTVKHYSIQSYQGVAPMNDQRYLENLR